MKNTKQNLTQVTNSLAIACVVVDQKEGKKHNLSNLFFFNKNKSIKAGILKDNKKVFITDNSVHFDNNVIIKENSQFLPKIKNSVNEYQTEKNKLNYWPTTEENNDSSNITNQKKVEISKLNKIKKGSLINNKVIEHLNSNIEYNLKKRLEFKNTYKFTNINTVPAVAFARGRDTTISQYLNTMSITNSKINTSPNLSKKYGTLLKYNKIISFNFLQNKQTVLINNNSKNKGEELEKIITKEIIEETYKLLFFYFKSIYCLISKKD
jgi:hypothetical protein